MYRMYMSIVCLHYDLKYIMGYVRVGVRLCIIDNHKYKATPVVTMGRVTIGLDGGKAT